MPNTATAPATHSPLPWQQVCYPHGGSRIRSGDLLVADTYSLGDSKLVFVAPRLLQASERLIEHLKNTLPPEYDCECPVEVAAQCPLCTVRILIAEVRGITLPHCDELIAAIQAA